MFLHPTPALFAEGRRQERERVRHRDYECFLTPREDREEVGRAVGMSQRISDISWERKKRDGQELAGSPTLGPSFQ